MFLSDKQKDTGTRFKLAQVILFESPTELYVSETLHSIWKKEAVWNKL